jgi:hypothetical protein
MGIFIQKLNPRAKALGPNQNKNSQIQLVKLPKQKVFVKLQNLSDKKNYDFTFDKSNIVYLRNAGKNWQRRTCKWELTLCVRVSAKALLIIIAALHIFRSFVFRGRPVSPFFTINKTDR